jgi:actin-related protein
LTESNPAHLDEAPNIPSSFLEQIVQLIFELLDFPTLSVRGGKMSNYQGETEKRDYMT